MRIADAIDIIVVAFFLYLAFQWLRSRATRAAALGICLMVALYTASRQLNMYMTSAMFQAGLTALLVALVIIFQVDIQRAFEHLGNLLTFNNRRRPAASSQSSDVLVETAAALAQNKIGALIVIKGREGLDRHLRGGHYLGGRISAPLIVSIFHPETPGHDGALIVEGDRIDRFAAHLPLSENLGEIGARGTRHTAALGLSERSDAFIIVVSEERGTISIAQNGKLEAVSTPIELKRRLDVFYRAAFPVQGPRTRAQVVTHNLPLKVAAAVAAGLLWFLFAFRVDTINRIVAIPVEYRNLPPGWEIEDAKPAETRVTLGGPERALNSLDASGLKVSLDLSTIQEGAQDVEVAGNSLSVPQGVRVVQIAPRTVRIWARQYEEKSLPVRAHLAGEPPAGYRLAGVKIEPQTVKVRMRTSRKGALPEIRTESLDLKSLREDTAIRLELRIPEYARLADNERNDVKVTVDMEQEKK